MGSNMHNLGVYGKGNTNVAIGVWFESISLPLECRHTMAVISKSWPKIWDNKLGQTDEQTGPDIELLCN